MGNIFSKLEKITKIKQKNKIEFSWMREDIKKKGKPRALLCVYNTMEFLYIEYIINSQSDTNPEDQTHQSPCRMSQILYPM